MPRSPVVSRKSHREDVLGVSDESSGSAARLDFPQAKGSIPRSRPDVRSIGKIILLSCSFGHVNSSKFCVFFDSSSSVWGPAIAVFSFLGLAIMQFIRHQIGHYKSSPAVYSKSYVCAWSLRVMYQSTGLTTHESFRSPRTIFWSGTRRRQGRLLKLTTFTSFQY